MVFCVAGFDVGSAYGSVYLFNVPNQLVPEERSANDFGVTVGGQTEYATRLLRGYDPRMLDAATNALQLNQQQRQQLEQAWMPFHLAAPYGILPLQDCIDLAVFFIKTTVAVQNLSIGVRGVGGAIDVAVITQRDGLRIIQRKELRAKQ
jgi:hypothetical protein